MIPLQGLTQMVCVLPTKILTLSEQEDFSSKRYFITRDTLMCLMWPFRWPQRPHLIQMNRIHPEDKILHFPLIESHSPIISPSNGNSIYKYVNCFEGRIYFTIVILQKRNVIHRCRDWPELTCGGHLLRKHSR